MYAGASASEGALTAAISHGQEMPVRPGQVLDGKFRVERVLGVGSMGLVVEATHVTLDERVALIASGGNVSREQLLEVLSREPVTAAVAPR